MPPSRPLLALALAAAAAAALLPWAARAQQMCLYNAREATDRDRLYYCFLMSNLTYGGARRGGGVSGRRDNKAKVGRRRQQQPHKPRP